MFRSFVLSMCLVIPLAPGSASAQTTVVSFSDLSLPGNQTYVNGAPPNPTPYNTTYTTFTSGGAVFNNSSTYYPGYDNPWTGWSYTNVTDVTSRGDINHQYSAYNLQSTGPGSINDNNTSSVYTIANVYNSRYNPATGITFYPLSLPATRRCAY